MPTYKAVIVGLTGIGARRPTEPGALPVYGTMPRSHAAAYHRHPQTEVVAVCDIRPEALTSFQREWADVWPEVRVYTDYRAMLAEEKPDLVSVCTPDHLHADITVDAANGGAKAILCEKPIATTLADADRMIAAAAANGVLLSIEHTRRWSPIFLKARALIRSGDFGPLRGITANMYSPRSMLFRNGTHLVDAVCYLANAAPLWVIAAHERGFENYGTVYKGEGGKDPSLDPGSTIIVEFANGVRALINSAKMTPALFEFDLQGPGGRYWLTDSFCKAWKTDKPEGTPSEVAPPQGRGYIDYFGENLIPAVQEIAQMVWHDGPNSSPPQRARDSLEIMLAALISQEQGSAKIQLPLPRS